MAYIDLIKTLPDGQLLGSIAYCWVSPKGTVYYSTCRYMMEMSAFVEKFNLLDECEAYRDSVFQKTYKFPTHYDFLISVGYAYFWAGETVHIYPDADTMKHGWHYKYGLLTEIQKRKIQQLTGESLT